MKNVLLDTNIFLRYLLNDIPTQTRQIEVILTRAKEHKVKLFAAQIIIFEIEFALNKYYKFPKNETIEKLDSILGADYFNIQDKNTFQQALELYTKKNLSFVDCFLISRAADQKQEIFSFDQELVKLSEKV